MNDVEVNNVSAQKVVVEEDTVKRQGLGSRMCGVVCGLGSVLKRALCSLVPSLATVITVPAMAIMLAMPVVLNEMCTKVGEAAPCKVF